MKTRHQKSLKGKRRDKGRSEGNAPRVAAAAQNFKVRKSKRIPKVKASKRHQPQPLPPGVSLSFESGHMKVLTESQLERFKQSPKLKTDTLIDIVPYFRSVDGRKIFGGVFLLYYSTLEKLISCFQSAELLHLSLKHWGNRKDFRSGHFTRGPSCRFCFLTQNGKTIRSVCYKMIQKNLQNLEEAEEEDAEGNNLPKPEQEQQAEVDKDEIICQVQMFYYVLPDHDSAVPETVDLKKVHVNVTWEPVERKAVSYLSLKKLLRKVVQKDFSWIENLFNNENWKNKLELKELKQMLLQFKWEVYNDALKDDSKWEQVERAKLTKEIFDNRATERVQKYRKRKNSEKEITSHRIWFLRGDYAKLKVYQQNSIPLNEGLQKIEDESTKILDFSFVDAVHKEMITKKTTSNTAESSARGTLRRKRKGKRQNKGKLRSAPKKYANRSGAASEARHSSTASESQLPISLPSTSSLVIASNEVDENEQQSQQELMQESLELNQQQQQQQQPAELPANSSESTTEVDIDNRHASDNEAEEENDHFDPNSPLADDELYNYEERGAEADIEDDLVDPNSPLADDDPVDPNSSLTDDELNNYEERGAEADIEDDLVDQNSPLADNELSNHEESGAEADIEDDHFDSNSPLADDQFNNYEESGAEADIEDDHFVPNSPLADDQFNNYEESGAEADIEDDHFVPNSPLADNELSNHEESGAEADNQDDHFNDSISLQPEPQNDLLLADNSMNFDDEVKAEAEENQLSATDSNSAPIDSFNVAPLSNQFLIADSAVENETGNMPSCEPSTSSSSSLPPESNSQLSSFKRPLASTQPFDNNKSEKQPKLSDDDQATTFTPSTSFAETIESVPSCEPSTSSNNNNNEHNIEERDVAVNIPEQEEDDGNSSDSSVYLTPKMISTGEESSDTVSTTLQQPPNPEPNIQELSNGDQIDNSTPDVASNEAVESFDPTAGDSRSPNQSLSSEPSNVEDAEEQQQLLHEPQETYQSSDLVSNEPKQETAADDEVSGENFSLPVEISPEIDASCIPADSQSLTLPQSSIDPDKLQSSNNSELLNLNEPTLGNSSEFVKSVSEEAELLSQVQNEAPNGKVDTEADGDNSVKGNDDKAKNKDKSKSDSCDINDGDGDCDDDDDDDDDDGDGDDDHDQGGVKVDNQAIAETKDEKGVKIDDDPSEVTVEDQNESEVENQDNVQSANTEAESTLIGENQNEVADDSQQSLTTNSDSPHSNVDLQSSPSVVDNANEIEEQGTTEVITDTMNIDRGTNIAGPSEQETLSDVNLFLNELLDANVVAFQQSPVPELNTQSSSIKRPLTSAESTNENTQPEKRSRLSRDAQEGVSPFIVSSSVEAERLNLETTTPVQVQSSEPFNEEDEIEQQLPYETQKSEQSNDDSLQDTQLEASVEDSIVEDITDEPMLNFLPPADNFDSNSDCPSLALSSFVATKSNSTKTSVDVNPRGIDSSDILSTPDSINQSLRLLQSIDQVDEIQNENENEDEFQDHDESHDEDQSKSQCHGETENQNENVDTNEISTLDLPLAEVLNQEKKIQLLATDSNSASLDSFNVAPMSNQFLIADNAVENETGNMPSCEPSTSSSSSLPPESNSQLSSFKRPLTSTQPFDNNKSEKQPKLSDDDQATTFTPSTSFAETIESVDTINTAAESQLFESSIEDSKEVHGNQLTLLQPVDPHELQPSNNIELLNQNELAFDQPFEFGVPVADGAQESQEVNSEVQNDEDEEEEDEEDDEEKDDTDNDENGDDDDDDFGDGSLNDDTNQVQDQNDDLEDHQNQNQNQDQNSDKETPESSSGNASSETEENTETTEVKSKEDIEKLSTREVNSNDVILSSNHNHLPLSLSSLTIPTELFYQSSKKVVTTTTEQWRANDEDNRLDDTKTHTGDLLPNKEVGNSLESPIDNLETRVTVFSIQKPDVSTDESNNNMLKKTLIEIQSNSNYLASIMDDYGRIDSQPTSLGNLVQKNQSPLCSTLTPPSITESPLANLLSCETHAANEQVPTGNDQIVDHQQQNQQNQNASKIVEIANESKMTDKGSESSFTQLTLIQSPSQHSVVLVPSSPLVDLSLETHLPFQKYSNEKETSKDDHDKCSDNQLHYLAANVSHSHYISSLPETPESLIHDLNIFPSPRSAISFSRSESAFSGKELDQTVVNNSGINVMVNVNSASTLNEAAMDRETVDLASSHLPPTQSRSQAQNDQNSVNNLEKLTQADDAEVFDLFGDNTDYDQMQKELDLFSINELVDDGPLNTPQIETNFEYHEPSTINHSDSTLQNSILPPLNALVPDEASRRHFNSDNQNTQNVVDQLTTNCENFECNSIDINGDANNNSTNQLNQNVYSILDIENINVGNDFHAENGQTVQFGDHTIASLIPSEFQDNSLHNQLLNHATVNIKKYPKVDILAEAVRETILDGTNKKPTESDYLLQLQTQSNDTQMSISDALQPFSKPCASVNPMDPTPNINQHLNESNSTIRPTQVVEPKRQRKRKSPGMLTFSRPRESKRKKKEVQDLANDPQRASICLQQMPLISETAPSMNHKNTPSSTDLLKSFPAPLEQPTGLAGRCSMAPIAPTSQNSQFAPLSSTGHDAVQSVELSNLNTYHQSSVCRTNTEEDMFVAGVPQQKHTFNNNNQNNQTTAVSDNLLQIFGRQAAVTSQPIGNQKTIQTQPMSQLIGSTRTVQNPPMNNYPSPMCYPPVNRHQANPATQNLTSASVGLTSDSGTSANVNSYQQHFLTIGTGATNSNLHNGFGTTNIGFRNNDNNNFSGHTSATNANSNNSDKNKEASLNVNLFNQNRSLTPATIATPGIALNSMTLNSGSQKATNSMPDYSNSTVYNKSNASNVPYHESHTTSPAVDAANSAVPNMIAPKTPVTTPAFNITAQAAPNFQYGNVGSRQSSAFQTYNHQPSTAALAPTTPAFNSNYHLTSHQQMQQKQHQFRATHQSTSLPVVPFQVYQHQQQISETPNQQNTSSFEPNQLYQQPPQYHQQQQYPQFYQQYPYPNQSSTDKWQSPSPLSLSSSQLYNHHQVFPNQNNNQFQNLGSGSNYPNYQYNNTDSNYYQLNQNHNTAHQYLAAYGSYNNLATVYNYSSTTGRANQTNHQIQRMQTKQQQMPQVLQLHQQQQQQTTSTQQQSYYPYSQNSHPSWQYN